jgi:replicative DNA helicase
MYLAALIDGLPHSSNVLDYARIVREKALLRQLIFTGNTIVQTAYDAELPATDILKAADRALLELQLVGDGRNLVEMRQRTKGLFDDLEHRVAHKGELTGIGTGFASIDELTQGWQAGDLIIVAARPSVGKSTFILNSAVAAAQQGKRVAIFSLEMRRRQLEFRVLASLSGIMLTKLLSGYINDFEYPKVSEALAAMDGLDIFVNDTAGLTAPIIRGKCRQLRADAGLDLVVVDYVQLMPGSLDRRGVTRNEEMTDISRRMKSLADELKVPVLLVSQLNRAAEGRADPRPKLSDLRESGALEQDCDVCLFLHRRNHREGGVTNAILDKMRNGPCGTVNLTLDRDITLFRDGGVEVAPTAAEQETEHREQTRRAFARRAHSR